MTAITAYETGKLAKVDPKSVLARYLAGETTTQIAKEYGITRQWLSHFLRRHAEEDWKEAQIVIALERKEQAEEELDAASDAVSLARARERLKAAQWDLERVYNRIYGQKQEVNHTVSIVKALESISVIEGEVVRDPEGECTQDTRESYKPLIDK